MHRPDTRGRARRAIGSVAMAAALLAAATPASAGDRVAREFVEADRSTGAMFRWWWPNAAVEQDELVAQLDAVADAGHKGVEIGAVLGLGPLLGSATYAVDPDRYGYGTPRWIAAVERVLEAAARRGLQVDLTLGAHWPPAVPGLDVDGAGATKELTYGRGLVQGGERFDGPVPAPAPRTYTDRTSDGGVIATVTKTARPTFVAAGAVRCLADCGGTPRVDLASNVDLTGRVRGGRLAWAPPDDGTWVIVGYWHCGTAIRNDLPLGPLPTLYSDPEARAIDYFSRDGVEAFAEYFETLLPRRTRELLRRAGGAVFDESIEIGAGAAYLWTPDFLREFDRRRGYSLVRYLPVVAAGTRPGFGGAPRPAFAFAGPDVAVRDRVLRDVEQTYSDLYLDEHVKPFRRWARSLGLDYRAQPYGQPIDIAQAAGHLDVPECENFACGTSDDWRLMTSGADMAGKRIVSDEMIPGITTAPRPGPYMVTHRDLLGQVNEQYALGANQMVFHGLPYSHRPPAADGSSVDDYTGWPGFHPFGAAFSEAFGPRQPSWTMESDTSAYLTRTQAVLQAGRRRTDVAIYNQSLGHVRDPFPGDALSGDGYSYGYVTPGLLASPHARVSDRRLARSGPAFKALVIADQETMPLAAARRIARLAADRLPVVVAGAPPGATPGFAATPEAAEADDRELRRIVAGVLAGRRVRHVAGVDDVPDALASLGVSPAVTSTAPAIRTVRRERDGTAYQYLYNGASERTRATVAVEAPRDARPYALDAWTGAVTPIARYVRRGPSVHVEVDLAPHEAAIVAVTDGRRLHATATTADEVRGDGEWLVARATRPGTYTTSLSDGRAVMTRVATLPDAVELHQWDLEVDDWRPAEPGQPSTAMNHVAWIFRDIELAPWRAIGGIEHAIGVGTYRTRVTLPPEWRGADGAYLRLGAVAGAFRVRVNGRTAAAANQLGAVVDTRRLRPGENEIEVRVATTMINRVRVAQPRFASVPAQDTGLLGPVSLTPYADMPLARER